MRTPLTPDELRKARKSMHLSAEELAGHLGVNRATVYKWERGEHPFPPYLGLAMEKLKIEYDVQQQIEKRKGRPIR